MNTRGLTALYLAALLALTVACEKKAPPRPIHTEPWLAHPPASAAASADAATPRSRYVLGAQSQVHFEVPSKHGALRGSFGRVSGEVELDPSDLTRTRGRVQVELSSITVSVDGNSDDAALLARVKNALGLAEGNSASATFELSSLEDVSPAQLEPAPGSDAAAPVVRRARATGVGNLLLHGFRVLRRVPLAAEFGFTQDRRVPTSIVIRTRAPFLVSLETHEIQAAEPQVGKKGAPGGARDARVSVELYGAKVN